MSFNALSLITFALPFSVTYVNIMITATRSPRTLRYPWGSTENGTWRQTHQEMPLGISLGCDLPIKEDGHLEFVLSFDYTFTVETCTAYVTIPVGEEETEELRKNLLGFPIS